MQRNMGVRGQQRFASVAATTSVVLRVLGAALLVADVAAAPNMGTAGSLDGPGLVLGYLVLGPLDVIFGVAGVTIGKKKGWRLWGT